MKRLSQILIFLSFVLLLWMILPRPIPIVFQIGNWKINQKIQPFAININVGNFKYSKVFVTQLGLDLKGGSSLVFESDTSRVKPSDLADALNSARDIIERRVNMFGISEPNIRTIKSGTIYRISVDLPGVTDVKQAVELIGQTAQLSFKAKADDTPESEATNTPAFLFLSKDTGVGGKDIRKATVVFDQQNGSPQVQLVFNEAGKKKFGAATTKYVGQNVGIFLDKFLLSAPVVKVPITDGNAVISGNFTVDEAKQLAVSINSGALPLPIKLVEQRNIGPTLGAIEVQRSVVAGVVGLSMVMLFMLIYYGRLGIAACIALSLYGAINLAIYRAVPIVLTLPGIAGFLLSIGMAVDSNILIFERIKEELRKGTGFNLAVKNGFGRAIDAIKDANITTLLVAFILFNPLNWEFLPQFGMVRGFALTLGIGVATSLFTGIVITRRLIKLVYRKSI